MRTRLCLSLVAAITLTGALGCAGNSQGGPPPKRAALKAAKLIWREGYRRPHHRLNMPPPGLV